MMRRALAAGLGAVLVAGAGLAGAAGASGWPDDDFRRLAPVQLYPVKLPEVGAPRPLSVPSPDVGQGVAAGDTLDASLAAPAAVEAPLPDIDWSYRRQLKPSAGMGLAERVAAGLPMTFSSPGTGDAWVLGSQNWRYSPGDGPSVTLGSYTPGMTVWGDTPQLGGVALSHSLTDGVVAEDQWQYAVAVGALDYTGTGRSGGLVYGPGASDALLRYGVSPEVALESQVQWAPNMVTAGVGGQYQTGLGAWRLGVARAARDFSRGWRYRVGYDVSVMDDIKLSWLNERRTGGFSDLSNYEGFSGDAGNTRNAWSATVPLGQWGDFSGTFEQVRSAGQPLKRQLGVSQQFWYSPNLRVSLSAQREEVNGDYGLGLQFSVPLR